MLVLILCSLCEHQTDSVVSVHIATAPWHRCALVQVQEKLAESSPVIILNHTKNSGVSNIFSTSGLHWKKKSCLGPHIKYTNTNENS